MQVLRTTSENKHFICLIEQLDKYLTVLDGEEHDFYNQFNGIDLLKNCIVIYDKDKTIACGAIKKMDDTSYEVKRMYVIPEVRGKGVATHILKELETWAKELGATHCILETGKRMQDAVQLYTKNGYARIENYGPYVGVENSVCFKKDFGS